MKRILFLLLILPLNTMAAGPYCKLLSEEFEAIVNVNDAPQFFAKAHSNGEVMFFIGEEGNYRVTLKDSPLLPGVPAGNVGRLPGSIDPVPSPDGKVLTIPGIKLFTVEEVLKKGKEAQPFYSDNTNGGVYQSVALVKIGEDTNIRTYRVVVDGTTNPKLNYRDYEVNFNNNPPTVKTSAPTTAHCPNRELQTIFVSKTGRYVTAFDVKTNTTKIFDMTDLTSTNRCRELYDLGYGTGKVEFSIGKSDNPTVFFEESDKKITFHLDYFGSDVGSYFSGVQSDRTKDVYTMDLIAPPPRERTGNWKLKTSNLRRLFSEATLGSGGYYPSWTWDGRVVSVFDDGDAYSFRVSDPERTKPYEFYLPPPSPSFEQAWADATNQPPQWKERFHRAAAIGALWANECIDDKDQLSELTGVGSLSFFLGLSKETCAQLVTAKWENLKTQVTNSPMWGNDPRFNAQMIHNYRAEDLVAACGAIKDRGSFQPPIIVGEPTANHLTREGMMHHYCMGCHVPGGQLLSITNESYPNTVDFTRGEGGFPKTTLAHLLSSKRRVKTGLDARANRIDPRPKDSMPPINPIQTDRTDIDHGETVMEILEEDIAKVTAMPKRVPLYLRGTGQVSQPMAARESVAPAEVSFKDSDGQFIRSFSMRPQPNLNQTGVAKFELVNNTDQMMTEIASINLTGSGFFYPGNNLFPGTNGTCGASLAPQTSCTFSVAFTPTESSRLYRTVIEVTYRMTVGAMQELRTVRLPLDGIAASVARNQ